MDSEKTIILDIFIFWKAKNGNDTTFSAKYVLTAIRRDFCQRKGDYEVFFVAVCWWLSEHLTVWASEALLVSLWWGEKPCFSRKSETNPAMTTCPVVQGMDQMSPDRVSWESPIISARRVYQSRLSGEQKPPGSLRRNRMTIENLVFLHKFAAATAFRHK